MGFATKKVNIRVLLAALAALVGLGGGLAVAAPAGASTYYESMVISQSVTSGFSNYGQGSRNIDISMYGTPNASFWYGVQDTTTGVWYSGPNGGWDSFTSAGSRAITAVNIPSSSCGHTFVGQLNDWGHVVNGNGAEFRTLPMVDNCGPMLGRNSSGYLYGNGFTPGATYLVTTASGSQAVTASSYATGYTYYSSVLGRIITVPPRVAGLISTNLLSDCSTDKAYNTSFAVVASFYNYGCNY